MSLTANDIIAKIGSEFRCTPGDDPAFAEGAKVGDVVDRVLEIIEDENSPSKREIPAGCAGAIIGGVFGFIVGYAVFAAALAMAAG